MKNSDIKNISAPMAACTPKPLREQLGLERKGQPPHPVTQGVDSERANVRSVKHPSAGGKH
jgi:hypothetical protein